MLGDKEPFDFIDDKEMWWKLKGIVQPKIKIPTLITHLMSFQTHKTDYRLKSESFLTLHRQQCNWHTFKDQKSNKDIIKK